MIDVAHDRHDRRARLQVRIFVGFAAEADLDVCFRNAFDGVTKLRCDQLGRVRIDNVIAAQHLALLDHELHHVRDPLVHAAGEVLQGDRFRQGDFDRNLLAAVAAAHLALTLALAGTAHGRQRTLTVCIVAKGRSDGQLAASAFPCIAAAGSRFAGAFPGAVILDGLAAALAAASLIIVRWTDHFGRGSVNAWTRLGGTLDHGFARSRFRGLSGLFLSLAPRFRLFAFTPLCQLAFLLRTQALLGGLPRLELPGTGILF